MSNISIGFELHETQKTLTYWVINKGERGVSADIMFDSLEYVVEGILLTRGGASMVLQTSDWDEYGQRDIRLVSDIPSAFRADGFYQQARGLVLPENITSGGALICGCERGSYQISDNIAASYNDLIEPDGSKYFVREWFCFRYRRASFKLWPLIPRSEYNEEAWQAIRKMPLDIYLDIMNGRLNPLDDQARRTMFAIGLI